MAANVGYCGLDAHRLPLNGDEIRSCWEAGPQPSSLTIAAAAAPTPLVPTEPFRAPIEAVGRPARTRQREFVEVGSATAGATRATPSDRAAIAGDAEPEDRTMAVQEPLIPLPGELRWSLWDDPAP